MKFRLFLIVIFALLTCITAFGADRIEPPKSCKLCGMDRVAFAHGRMMILYADGTSAATCSLNCAAVEMKANKGKRVKSLKVADYSTKRLVDAKSAIWVLGGSKPGIMTEMPKWAFAKRDDAVKFIKEYGGRITDFNEALNLALRENEQ